MPRRRDQRPRSVVSSEIRNDPFAGSGEMAALMRAKDWSATATRPGRHVAAKPEDDRRCAPHVAIRDVDGMGARPHLPVQRRLRGDDARRQAPVGAGPAFARSLGRDLAGDRAADRRACCATARRRGTRTCCSSSSAADIAKRPTTRSRTARSPTTRARSAASCASSAKETERVIGERRMALLRDTAAGIRRDEDRGGTVCAPSSARWRVRGTCRSRSPICSTMTAGRHSSARSGIAATHPAAAAIVQLDDDAAPWPLAAAQGAPVVVELSDRVAPLPTGPWHGRPKHALVAPIAAAGQGCAGVFVGGAQPFPAVRRRVSQLCRPVRRPDCRRPREACAPTRRSDAARRRWPKSIARRRRSSATSATSSGRR